MFKVAFRTSVVTMLMMVASSAHSDGEPVSSAIWSDKSRKISWQVCSVGQSWDGINCNGGAKEYTPSEAQEIVKQLKNGWRLPTASELASIVKCSTGLREPPFPRSKDPLNKISNGCKVGSHTPVIDKNIFPETARFFYLTSSVVEGFPKSVWGVSFDDGSLYAFNSDEVYFHVRLVRDNP